MKEIWNSLNKFYFANFAIVFAIIFSIIFMFFVQFKVEKLQDEIAQNRINISDTKIKLDCWKLSGFI